MENLSNNTFGKILPKHCFPPSINATSPNSSSMSYVGLMDFILTGPLLTGVISLGILGNITCSMIFYKRFKRFRIYLFLLVLAFWDLALVVGSLFVFSLPTLLYGTVVLYGQYAPVYPFAYFFCNVARNGSVWIVLVIAIERYFALCYPYQFETFNTQRRAYVLLLSVSVSAFIYGIPRFFELRIDQCWNPNLDAMVPEVQPTLLRLNRLYWLIYRVAGGFVFYSAGPFLVLIILTIRISIEIQRGIPVTPRTHGCNEKYLLRPKQKTSKKNPQEKSESINHWMHVAVITKFLICHSLPTILDIYNLIDPAFLRTDTGMLVGHCSNLLVVLNSSCNFFVYVATSTHFKRDLRICVSGKKAASDLYSTS